MGSKPVDKHGYIIPNLREICSRSRGMADGHHMEIAYDTESRKLCVEEFTGPIGTHQAVWSDGVISCGCVSKPIRQQDIADMVAEKLDECRKNGMYPVVQKLDEIKKERYTRQDRKCVMCGKLFERTVGSSAVYCPECRKKAMAATVVRPRKCIMCGDTFQGGPRASYCPICRKIRAKETKKEYEQRQKMGGVRSLGSTDICQKCGKPYIVNGSKQMYCPTCAPIAIAEKVAPVKRQYNKENMDNLKKNTKILTHASRICMACGGPIPPERSGFTCSDECLKKLNDERSERTIANRPPRHKKTDK